MSKIKTTAAKTFFAAPRKENKMPSRNRGSASFKTARINEEIARELNEILRSVKDPRISGAFISIVNVDTTPDLKYCKVRFSVYNGDAAQAAKGLKSASHFRHYRKFEK